jgi:hypothetical protein
MSVIIIDSLWEEISKPQGKKIFLCYPCIENRLGRRIKLSDLKDVKMNETAKFLLERQHKLRQEANEKLIKEKI